MAHHRPALVWVGSRAGLAVRLRDIAVRRLPRDIDNKVVWRNETEDHRHKRTTQNLRHKR